MNLTDEEKAKEADFIRDEWEWPHWPVLPMKRGGKDYGILVSGQLNVVYLINVFRLKSGDLHEQLKKVERQEFKTVEDMLDAGWVVD